MSKSLADYWRRYRALARFPRELVTFGLCLLVALAVLPVAIFLAGQVFLGDFIRDPSGAPEGGLGAFWVDFIKGIGVGSSGHWLVLLGPWLLLTATRGVRALVRHERRARDRLAVAPAEGAKRDINQPLA